jgi:hypothetical protein
MNFKNWLLTESKNSIVSLGLPSVIAELFYEKFGNSAPLLARWYSETINGKWNRQEIGKELFDLVFLYEHSKNKEDYLKALEKLELYVDNEDVLDVDNERVDLKNQIRNELFHKYFFLKKIIKEIEVGKIKDLSPYKNLSIEDAITKYDKKRIFEEMKPLRTYPDGYKWINVGKECSIIASEMSNCGNAGWMTDDRDGTILALFSPDNKPHAIVTYSPNKKIISGDQGAASSEVKEKYHDYILDLVDFLGVKMDEKRTKSQLLLKKYKYRI